VGFTNATASAQAASERNLNSGVYRRRTLSVVLLDFGGVSVSRNVSQASPLASFSQFSGKSVPSLLR
jgi:hypothetical protein